MLLEMVLWWHTCNPPAVAFELKEGGGTPYNKVLSDPTAAGLLPTRQTTGN